MFGMNVIQAAILGIVEGVTEYLPISSTFHLIWAGKLLGIPQTDFQKLFEVVIQSGAILAVLVLYIREFLGNWKLLKKMIVSFIPTAMMGLLFFKIIKDVFFENVWLQLGVFLGVGILFIIFEKRKLSPSNSLKVSGHSMTKMLRPSSVQVRLPIRSADEISYKEALMVGLMQAAAIVPGVSRAGAVIIAMMALDVKREEGAKYSFLLAVPTLFAASALDLFKSRDLLRGQMGQVSNLGLIAVGLVMSFLSAMVVVKWFVAYLQKHDISVFGWYRIGVAVVLLIVWVIWGSHWYI
jgi:undecaprenyl-diphosphatase